MAKRQVRFLDPENEKNKENLMGKQLSVCLNNKSVFVGSIIAFSEKGIMLKDMLKRNHQISFKEISEIILEKEGTL